MSRARGGHRLEEPTPPDPPSWTLFELTWRATLARRRLRRPAAAGSSDRAASRALPRRRTRSAAPEVPSIAGLTPWGFASPSTSCPQPVESRSRCLFDPRRFPDRDEGPRGRGLDRARFSTDPGAGRSVAATAAPPTTSTFGTIRGSSVARKGERRERRYTSGRPPVWCRGVRTAVVVLAVRIDGRSRQAARGPSRPRAKSTWIPRRV
jgi:hypothetical protein